MSIALICECGRHFNTPDTTVGQGVLCPNCGCELTVPKPSLLFEDDRIPFKPELTVTSGKAIASLILGGLIFLGCLSGVPAIMLGRSARRDIRNSGGRLTGERLAVAGMVLGLIGCLFTAVVAMAAFSEDIEVARRFGCSNNLKQIGFAFFGYFNQHDCFPAAAVTDKRGKPLLSWRVAILPYLEQRSLYDKFHLDEAWDSPHNFALLKEMPRFFECQSDRTRKLGMTGYLAVIGPDTAFRPDFKPLTINDFRDGINNTIFIGESGHCVPWTKPEDLPFDLSVPLSGLGSHHGRKNEGFNVLIGDGSVRFVKSAIAPEQLRRALNRSDSAETAIQSY